MEHSLWLSTVVSMRLCWQNRTHLGKCTHQYDEKQGNNNTQALLTNIVFFGCKKIDNKRRRKYKEEDRQEGADVRNVKNEYVQ